jgi:PAS domain S-box-containing protein
MSERPKGIAEGDVVSLREELLVQLWIAVQDGIQRAVTLCDGSGRDSPKPQKAERRSRWLLARGDHGGQSYAQECDHTKSLRVAKYITAPSEASATISRLSGLSHCAVSCGVQICCLSYTEGIPFASSANSSQLFSSMPRETSGLHKTESDPEGLIHGNSRMAEVIRTHDWSLTPLGPIEVWPEALLFSANLMLSCAFPALVLWGKGLVQLYNDAFIPLLAERHPSGLGQTAQECWWDAWQIVGPNLKRVMNDGETVFHENTVVPIVRDGRLQDIRWTYSYSPIFGAGRDPLGVLVICQDVTREVAAAQELRKSQQGTRESAKRLGELAAIIASSDDVILSKDLNGTITSWNDAATRLFGYSPEEMVGASILKLIPEHLHSDEKTILENIRAGRRIEHFETVRRAKDGRLIDVSLTVSPIKDEEGRVIGASKILRDVSSRKRMEQSLLQAEKIAATGRMAATIAHEVNNPLAAVMNLLYLLRAKITDDEGRGFLATAEDELGRVSHIAKQTLGYYREHAAASLASVSEIAEHAFTIYEPRCTTAGITIRKSISPSTKIVLRRGEMMQVISNLIVNSIYAMPHGGTLSISVCDDSSAGNGVVLTVEDDGVGIRPKDLPKVFDAFFTTRNTVGTGIGLFVAKQFVQGHGGRISIESDSESEKHGTIVRVFLPLHTAYE